MQFLIIIGFAVALREVFLANLIAYINRQHLEEINIRFKVPKYYAFSILGAAMDCGINSKYSFGTVFQKYTGAAVGDFNRKELAAF